MNETKVLTELAAHLRRHEFILIQNMDMPNYSYTSTVDGFLIESRQTDTGIEVKVRSTKEELNRVGRTVKSLFEEMTKDLEGLQTKQSTLMLVGASPD